MLGSINSNQSNREHVNARRKLLSPEPHAATPTVYSRSANLQPNERVQATVRTRTLVSSLHSHGVAGGTPLAHHLAVATDSGRIHGSPRRLEHSRTIPIAGARRCRRPPGHKASRADCRINGHGCTVAARATRSPRLSRASVAPITALGPTPAPTLRVPASRKAQRPRTAAPPRLSRRRACVAATRAAAIFEAVRIRCSASKEAACERQQPSHEQSQ